MYLTYLDESGNTGTDLDNKQQPIFVLGGFVLNHSDWHITNSFFNKEKIKICDYFKCNEIHTNEIFSPPHKSIFHIEDWEKNFVILDKLVDLIMELNITFRFIAIDKKGFKANIQEKMGDYIKIDPYIYSFCLLYNLTSQFLEEKEEKGIIFLDDIISIPQYLKNIYPKISLGNKSIIEQALFLKSRDTNFIQIADIYSFYICQYLNIMRGYKKYNSLKNNHCINNYKKLISKTDMSKTKFLTKNFPEEYFQ